MPSLVLGLQHKAMYNQGSVSDLLRMAYTVARKLKIEEFASWAKQELDGYGGITDDHIPEYRTIHGRLRAFNPYRGWIPAVLSDAELSQLVEHAKVFEPVAEIEHLLHESEDYLQKEIPQGQSQALGALFQFDTMYTLMVSRSEFEGLLQHIRQRILEWALQLEEEGILGNDIQFSEEEKRTAQSTAVQSWTTNNFIAPGGTQQLQQGTTHSTQSMEIQQRVDVQQLKTLTTQVREYLEQTKLGKEEQSDILNELDILDEQVQSGSPEPGVIAKSLTFIRGVLEKAAGTVVATGLLALIDKFPH